MSVLSSRSIWKRFSSSGRCMPMSPERPFTRPEDLGEETVDGWERTTEDVLQFVYEKPR